MPVARSRLALIALWLLASIPSAAVSGGVFAAIRELTSNGSSDFFFSLGPVAGFLLGAVYGASWLGCLAIPYFGLLWLWASASRLFGDTDQTRLRILLGMGLCSIPQALLLSATSGLDTLAPAWLTVTFALWLPRALLPALRPGAFLEASPRSR